MGGLLARLRASDNVMCPSVCPEIACYRPPGGVKLSSGGVNADDSGFFKQAAAGAAAGSAGGVVNSGGADSTYGQIAGGGGGRGLHSSTFSST